MRRIHVEVRRQNGTIDDIGIIEKEDNYTDISIETAKILESCVERIEADDVIQFFEE